MSYVFVVNGLGDLKMNNKCASSQTDSVFSFKLQVWLAAKGDFKLVFVRKGMGEVVKNFLNKFCISKSEASAKTLHITSKLVYCN